MFRLYDANLNECLVLEKYEKKSLRLLAAAVYPHIIKHLRYNAIIFGVKTVSASIIIRKSEARVDTINTFKGYF